MAYVAFLPVPLFPFVLFLLGLCLLGEGLPVPPEELETFGGGSGGGGRGNCSVTLRPSKILSLKADTDGTLL